MLLEIRPFDNLSKISCKTTQLACCSESSISGYLTESKPLLIYFWPFVIFDPINPISKMFLLPHMSLIHNAKHSYSTRCGIIFGIYTISGDFSLFLQWTQNPRAIVFYVPCVSVQCKIRLLPTSSINAVLHQSSLQERSETACSKLRAFLSNRSI